MPECAYKDCSITKKYYGGNDVKVTFYSFPQNVEYCEKWVEVCSEKFKRQKFPLETLHRNGKYKICCTHFLNSDFANLNDMGIRYILKSTAIPVSVDGHRPRDISKPQHVSYWPTSQSRHILKATTIPVSVGIHRSRDICKPQLVTVRPSSQSRSNFSGIVSKSASDAECTSAACSNYKTELKLKFCHNYVELNEEKAHNSELKRQNELLLERIQFLENIVSHNDQSINSVHIKMEEEDLEVP